MSYLRSSSYDSNVVSRHGNNTEASDLKRIKYCVDGDIYERKVNNNNGNELSLLEHFISSVTIKQEEKRRCLFRSKRNDSKSHRLSRRSSWVGKKKKNKEIVLSSDMLRLSNRSVPLEVAESWKDFSADKPHMLLGWQIMIQSDNFEDIGIAVVTGIRKNWYFQTEFRLSTSCCVNKDCDHNNSKEGYRYGAAVKRGDEFVCCKPPLCHAPSDDRVDHYDRHSRMPMDRCHSNTTSSTVLTIESTIPTASPNRLSAVVDLSNEEDSKDDALSDGLLLQSPPSFFESSSKPSYKRDLSIDIPVEETIFEDRRDSISCGCAILMNDHLSHSNESFRSLSHSAKKVSLRNTKDIASDVSSGLFAHSPHSQNQSNKQLPDVWVRLKRRGHKGGVEFLPRRKVIDIDRCYL